MFQSFSDRQGKHAFAQDCSYFQGIFSYINKSDTSSPKYKMKHMLENGAPPYKFGVLHRLLHIEFHGFNKRILVLVLSHFLFQALTQFFTDSMGPLNKKGPSQPAMSHVAFVNIHNKI